MLRQEKEQLSRQEQGINKEMQKYSEELCLVEKEINEAKKVIEQHQKKHRETQSERDNLHADITDFKIAVNSITESLRNVEEDINRITGEKESLKAGIDKKFREKARCAREIEELKSENEVLKQKINTHEQESKGKTFEIDRILEERRVLEDELKEINQSLTDINKNLLLLQEEYSRIEVRKAKNEVETEAIQNRLWDEYELTYANAMEYKKDIGGMGQAQRKIEEYKAQIRELGVVNVAAIEEYAKTKERFEFMTEQKNDMEQAEKKLQRVIAEMISIMKRQFMEQFKKINENFNIVFRELFDGGRASLILEDDENVLESGIDIEAQPPGKKLQNLMLLSGGERALTAIALLFAILRLKPTPFCVLDEIEAALDEANVYRFSQYLRRFSEQTQFIMITHRKGTMEGSDVLYGVTMEERGISKIVSMKMDESKAG
jgi:chromosome segregation protein